jgi:hypothetical protein
MYIPPLDMSLLETTDRVGSYALTHVLGYGHYSLVRQCVCLDPESASASASISATTSTANIHIHSNNLKNGAVTTATTSATPLISDGITGTGTSNGNCNGTGTGIQSEENNNNAESNSNSSSSSSSDELIRILRAKDAETSRKLFINSKYTSSFLYDKRAQREAVLARQSATSKIRRPSSVTALGPPKLFFDKMHTMVSPTVPVPVPASAESTSSSSFPDKLNTLTGGSSTTSSSTSTSTSTTSTTANTNININTNTNTDTNSNSYINSNSNSYINSNSNSNSNSSQVEGGFRDIGSGELTKYAKEISGKLNSKSGYDTRG